MVSIAVLGDSFSVKGYGIDEEAQTWPFLLQSELGADTTVKVCARGGLLASLTGATVDGNYFGCSKQLGGAMNTKVDAFLICLGTNDALQSGFTGAVEGCVPGCVLQRAEDLPGAAAEHRRQGSTRGASLGALPGNTRSRC